LPDKTRRILEKLSICQGLSEFTLIGGTALALQVAHRFSEDLDLAASKIRLPRQDIDNLIAELIDMGCIATLSTNDFTRQQWDNEGGDIDDFQQDWNIDGVKISFWTMNSEVQSNFVVQNRDYKLNNLNILSSDGIFELKSRLLVKRTASRDGFDLWYFLAHCGRSLDQIFALAQAEDKYYSYDQLYQRLAPANYPPYDPGFEAIMKGAPANRDQLKKALAKYVKAFQEKIAADLFKNV